MSLEIMDQLQERIMRLIELVNRLKREIQQLQYEKTELISRNRLIESEQKQQLKMADQLKVALAELEDIRKEAESLRQERNIIRDKIERILADLETLDTTSSE